MARNQFKSPSRVSILPCNPESPKIFEFRSDFKPFVLFIGSLMLALSPCLWLSPVFSREGLTHLKKWSKWIRGRRETARYGTSLV